MDTLLASACEACGWTATIGELLDLLPDQNGWSRVQELLDTMSDKEVPDSIWIQSTRWHTDLASTLWSTPPRERRLLAILQWDKPWGTFRQGDRFVLADPRLLAARPLLTTPHQPPPPDATGMVTLVWAPVDYPLTTLPSSCPCSDRLADIPVGCSLCNCSCPCGGHPIVHDGFTLCLTCSRKWGHTPTDPYCVICQLPTRGDRLQFSACQCGAHTACAKTHMICTTDYKIWCRRPACAPARPDSPPFSASCMGSCGLHLTLDPAHVRCTGSCGRGWCHDCRPLTTLCCRHCTQPRSRQRTTSSHGPKKYHTGHKGAEQ